ncbi:uncharacterized protein UHO2_06343 [Ustilago hordei]|uniref:uncharacterized protein n=1 Tax=Ustilago hordei TaxID=120017 RepID=UPI001A516B40|nr:uncharacterized protein UHO2_06343 [Ustilago hordei]SYW80881.1 uncharacterized protein UHO2_06343 [Ustilago hordei]
MHPSASSSSGARSEIENFSYYSGGRVRYDPNRKALEGSDLEEHFGAELHYDGVPMLNVEKVPVSKVQDAMATYKRVWIVGRPSPTGGYKYMQLIKGGGEDILVRPEDEDDIRKHFLDAQKFGLDNGKEAQGLLYGRPFDKRKRSIFRPYKVPEWEAIEKPEITVYDLKNTRFRHLRSTLDQYNYLKIRDSARGKLLGFKLDKDGGVLFKDLSHYLGRA